MRFARRKANAVTMMAASFSMECRTRLAGGLHSRFCCIAGIGNGAGLVLAERLRRAAAGFLDDGRERVTGVADLAKERPDARLIVHEHRRQFSGGGGVAEAAKDFRPSAAKGVDEGAAALGFIAEHPHVTAVVREVCALVLDVQQAGPHALFAEAEVVAPHVFEKDFAAFATRHFFIVCVPTLRRTTVRFVSIPVPPPR